MKDFEVEMPVSRVAKGGLWVAYLCAFSDAVCFTYIFAFLPYYVEFLLSDQLPADKEARDSEVAYHSGLLGSSYSAGQVLSAFLAGSISDKVGRRPVILAGSLVIVVVTAVFAYSPPSPGLLLSVFSYFSPRTACSTLLLSLPERF